MTVNLHALARLGHSIWYDNIRRALIESGELQDLLAAGVTGVTSNPSIFEKAIAGSADYDTAIMALAGSAQTSEAIYETLALEDIRRTADLLAPIYQSTAGVDGYVSLEVSPTLAHQTAETITAARRLYAALDRPNVMIKVPATPAGIPAIKALIGEGINVNVTLIFSLAHYEAVAEAYLSGLELLAENGGDVRQVASVASFFISRVDTVIDGLLTSQGQSELLGQIGVANAKVAYARFGELFSGGRWEALASRGARVQRPLWASTGTKNPHYPDTLYVDELIGPHTVNTVPPATLNAFRDHGTVSTTLTRDVAEARRQLAKLADLGIDLEAVTQTLQDDGVAAFAKSFEALVRSVSEKRQKLQTRQQAVEIELGSYQGLVDVAMSEMQANAIMQRIWAHDHTVWKPDPTEISNRLGWLHSAERMLDEKDRLQAFVDEVRAAGYTHALLLGMGGSSLAPDVFHRVFGAHEGYLDLAVLDSTDPSAVAAQSERLPYGKTLFIVSTKSGGTSETLSFFKYFYNQLAAQLGANGIGQHFVAITDPGSKLELLARQYQFRATFLNDANIGGRYSALSYFGLVPAALLGVDVVTLLDRALVAGCNCESCNCPPTGDNNGARLGVVMGEMAKAGHDKITFITSPSVAAFGDWVEQLIAESTGKEGHGILPVVTEIVGDPAV
jgi:transaldolase/glucose-6-phosphate isomerase